MQCLVNSERSLPVITMILACANQARCYCPGWGKTNTFTGQAERASRAMSLESPERKQEGQAPAPQVEIDTPDEEVASATTKGVIPTKNSTANSRAFEQDPHLWDNPCRH